MDTGGPAAVPDNEGRIVAALVARGRLKEADLARARRVHDESGGSLLGLLGALIAIPVAASILILYRQVLIPRMNER